MKTYQLTASPGFDQSIALDVVIAHAATDQWPQAAGDRCTNVNRRHYFACPSAIDTV